MDADIINEFIEESREHLADIEVQLLSIEALGEDIDDDLVNTVFRAIHSTKGAAGFLGLTQINEVAHRLENVLGMIREHRLIPDPYNVDVMLKAADCLSSLIDDIDNSNDTDNSELCEKLDVVLAGVDSPAASSDAEGESADAASDEATSPDAESVDPKPANQADAKPASADAAKDPASDRVGVEMDRIEKVVSADLSPSPAPAPATPKPAAKPAAAEKGSEKGGKSEARIPADATIRVSVRVLDQLMNLAGELVLSRNQLMRGLSAIPESANLDKIASRLDQVTTELQENIMQTRMQPIGNVFSKFPRVIRDLSSQLGKSIDLKMEGTDVETDKTIVEAIADPLTHLIRNSCDHGIETPEARTAKGKPETGKIRLRAFHQAGKVMIEIVDDGAGMDPTILKNKAIEKGVLTPEAAQQLSDHDAVNLIFAPGFSTAAAITEVSGRGVGMDVVRTNIEKIGGNVEVESELGAGSTIRITLPLTLAIVPSMIVSVADRRFALPQVNILELVQTGGPEKRIERVNNAEVLRLRGNLLPLVRLDQMLGLDEETVSDDDDGSTKGPRNEQQLVVVETGRARFAIGVDRVLDSEEIVVKPLGNHLKDLPLFAGSTILGDGHVAMILDVSGITSASNIGVDVESQAEPDTEETPESDIQRMVMLSLNDTDHFAISMDVVSRIERVPATQIETIGKHRMIKYRDSTLALVGVEEGVEVGTVEQPEYLYLIVFSVYGHEVGLIAPRIDDINQCDLSFSDANNDSAGVAAVVVVDGRMTRVLDIYGLTETARPEWFKKPATSSDGEDLEHKPRTILVCEDSKFFRNFLVTTLLEEGHVVDSFEDGELGWQHLSTCDRKYDMLLTDIEMPNLDGLGLTRRVRESENFADMPVIALTSLADKNSVGRGIDAGVTDYQVKMNKPDLLNAIARFGGGRHSQFQNDLVVTHSHLEEVS